MTNCCLQLGYPDGYALRGGDTGRGLGEVSKDDELSLGHADLEIRVGHPSGDGWKAVGCVVYSSRQCQGGIRMRWKQNPLSWLRSQPCRMRRGSWGGSLKEPQHLKDEQKTKTLQRRLRRNCQFSWTNVNTIVKILAFFQI